MEKIRAIIFFMRSKLLIFTLFSMYWHLLSANSPSTPQQGQDSHALTKMEQEFVVPSLSLALDFYNKKDYDKALENLQHLQKLQGNSPVLSYNLALTHWQKKERAQSFSYIRQCLDQEPGFKSCELFIDQLSKADLAIFYKKRDFIERLLIDFHRSAHWSIFALLSLLLFSLFFRASVRVYKKILLKKQEEPEELGPSPNQWILSGFMGLIFLISLSFSLSQWQLSQEERASLLVDSPGLLSNRAGSPEVLDLIAGEEVMLVKRDAKWAQIEDFHGKRAWIEIDKLFLNQERTK